MTWVDIRGVKGVSFMCSERGEGRNQVSDSCDSGLYPQERNNRALEIQLSDPYLDRQGELGQSHHKSAGLVDNLMCMANLEEMDTIDFFLIVHLLPKIQN